MGEENGLSPVVLGREVTPSGRGVPRWMGRKPRSRSGLTAKRNRGFPNKSTSFGTDYTSSPLRGNTHREHILMLFI